MWVMTVQYTLTVSRLFFFSLPFFNAFCRGMLWTGLYYQLALFAAHELWGRVVLVRFGLRYGCSYLDCFIILEDLMLKLTF
jgi:hypothetical protein